MTTYGLHIGNTHWYTTICVCELVTNLQNTYREYTMIILLVSNNLTDYIQDMYYYICMRFSNQLTDYYGRQHCKCSVWRWRSSSEKKTDCMYVCVYMCMHVGLKMAQQLRGEDQLYVCMEVSLCICAYVCVFLCRADHGAAVLGRRPTVCMYVCICVWM